MAYIEFKDVTRVYGLSLIHISRRPSCVGGHWTCAFGDGKRDGARMEMNEKKSHLRYPLGPVHMVSLQT